MKNETPRQLIRTPEIRSLFAGEPFTEPALEINDLIARRAYELFESSGFTHDHEAARVIRSKGRNDHLFRTALQTHLPSGGAAI